jgi:hypothetical protein
MKSVRNNKFLIWTILAIVSLSLKAQEGEENINDPTLAQEEGATGMEGFEGDGENPGELENEALAENQVNPEEEEEIDDAMKEENFNENAGMFGGGADGEMIGKMGLGGESQEEGENHEELDPAVEEYFNEEEKNNGHEQVDHEIPEENLDHEQEYQGHEEEIPGDQIIDHGLIALEHHTELEKMKNFKKISDDCKIFLEEFRDCLDNIPDPAWEEKEIQKCVGKDFTRVVNNICKWFKYLFNLKITRKQK